MDNRRCMLFETLGKVSDLQVQENKSNNGCVRLSGVFGVCGVKNQNNRIYDKANYAQMVESLQKTIMTEGCPGELEHPNSFNINLENVSHKIESIEMNEDGTITGTILLLNTPKGKIAQAIVEGGLPLYISSRAMGNITNEGYVTLTALKTYDLVGTPGFSQAKLTLAENQTVESLNENLEDGNIMWAIVEESKDDKDSKDDKKSENLFDDPSDKKDDKSDKEEKPDKKDEDEKSSEDKQEDTSSENDKEDKKDNIETVNMEDIKKSIDQLTDRINKLEASLHVAQESAIEIPVVNYSAVEKWVTEEFAPEFSAKIKGEITSSIRNEINEAIKGNGNAMFKDIKGWVNNEFANKFSDTIAESIENWVKNELVTESKDNVQEVKTSDADSKINEAVTEKIDKLYDYINNEYSNNLQNWLVEHFATSIQSWITEEYSSELQNWITEEYSAKLQDWITEEYSTTVSNWVNEQLRPEIEETITENINESINERFAESNTTRLEEIDSLLETLSSNKDMQQVVKEAETADRFGDVYAVSHMPSEYTPSWNMLSEARQEEIIRSSKMYDFTKKGVLESFWSSVDFDKKSEAETPVVESKDILNDYHSGIYTQMMRLRH